MAELSVKTGARLNREEVCDPIDRIVVKRIVLVNRFVLVVHGKSSSCTLSNSAKSRLR